MFPAFEATPIHIVAGFSHCGTHSLHKYLQNLGHESVHADGLYAKFWQENFFEQNHDFKDGIFYLITRDAALNTDRLQIESFEEYYKQFENYKLVVVRLEDMTKVPGFPVLNARIETLKRLEEEKNNL